MKKRKLGSRRLAKKITRQHASLRAKQRCEKGLRYYEEQVKRKACRLVLQDTNTRIWLRCVEPSGSEVFILYSKSLKAIVTFYDKAMFEAKFPQLCKPKLKDVATCTALVTKVE